MAEPIRIVHHLRQHGNTYPNVAGPFQIRQQLTHADEGDADEEDVNEEVDALLRALVPVVEPV
eukprot:2507251-Prymnesium_polylepis.2